MTDYTYAVPYLGGPTLEEAVQDLANVPTNSDILGLAKVAVAGAFHVAVLDGPIDATSYVVDGVTTVPVPGNSNLSEGDTIFAIFGLDTANGGHLTGPLDFSSYSATVVQGEELDIIIDGDLGDETDGGAFADVEVFVILAIAES